MKPLRQASQATWLRASSCKYSWAMQLVWPVEEYLQKLAGNQVAGGHL